MARVNVNPEDKQRESDIFTLTNVVTDESVALIPSDSAGNFSWTGITKAPIVRNAMQTSTTSGEWSDLEYPYMAMPQEDWSGGRANLRFTIDKSRYYDSRRAQAAFNQCIYNAPLDYYSILPGQKAYTNCPASLTWIKVNDSTSYMIRAISVSSFSCGHVYIHLRRHGKPTNGLTVRLVNNRSGSTVYATHTYTTAEITDITAEFRKFNFSPVTLNGTVYLEIFSEGNNTSDYWEVGCTLSSVGQTYRSYNGSSWDLYNYDLLYRLDEYVATPFKAKFFMYEQVMFAVQNRANGCSVISNGTIGRCVSATATTITAANNSFTGNVFAGAKIRIVYGQGAHVVKSAQRTVVSNTTNTITVDEAWDITPAAGSIFVVTDTPHWIQMETFANRITDIHVIRDCIYFCFGDYLPVIKKRYNFSSGVWENKTITGVYATFLQSVRDRNGLMLYRGRNDGINHKRTVERARLLDWEASATTWASVSTAITTVDATSKEVSKTVVTKETEPAQNTVSTTITTADTEPKQTVKNTHTVTATNNISNDQVTTNITAVTKETIGGQQLETDRKVTVGDKTSVTDGTTTTVTEDVTVTQDEREYEAPISSTVTTTKTGTVNGQTVTSSVTEQKAKNVTVAVSGNNKTVTTTETNTTTSAERTLVKPVDTDVTTTTQTKINGQVSETETVNTSLRITEAVANGNKVTTTTESNTINTTTTPQAAIRESITTESKDFSTADYDTRQYVITIGSFASDNNTGKCVITLQESEDNQAFTDVQSVIAGSAGTWRIFAHCQYRYRRFVITATGTNCTVNNIAITTSDIPHFEDPVFLLDNYGKITRLFEYGSEQEKSLWIFQEGMVSSINKTESTLDTYNHDRINLDELQVTTEEWNGSAVGTSDVYLLWSWLNGLQRYYNTQIEGKGPDHDEGMPMNMQGRITQIAAYPGSFFVSIDGEDGYSSVMMYNGSGWHNLYRAPNEDERIYDIAFQPIYGERPDRLWIQVGDNIIWLAMPSKVLYALQDPHAEYTHESVLTSAWFTGGMAEVDKLWQSISIMADNLGKNCWIEADYQLDDEPEWHPIPTNPFIVSPQQEEKFASANKSVNGKKLRYRLRLQTNDMYKSPKVNVVMIKAIGRVDIKYSYGFHFRNIKHKADLMGEYEEIEPYELDALLSDWANKLATLRLNSVYKLYDNKYVFLDGLTTNVVYEKSEGYLSQITLTEI